MSSSQTLEAGITAPAARPSRRIRVNTKEAGPVPVPVEFQKDGQPIPEPPSYIERMAEQRKQFKQQDRARFYAPDRDPEGQLIWEVYAWTLPPRKKGTAPLPLWQHVGQRRKKPGRRKPMTMNRLFAMVRRQFGLDKDTMVTLISSADDLARKSRREELPAPQHFETNRPVTPLPASLKKLPRERTTVTRVRKDVAPKLQLDKRVDSAGRVTFTFKTRYVGWGWSAAKKSWIYLGPALEQTKKRAHNELRGRFTLYMDIRVIDVKNLTYSLRTRLKSGAVLPGVTKMALPEVRA